MKVKYERRSKAFAGIVYTSTPPHLHPTHGQWRIVEDKEEKCNRDGENNCGHPTYQQWRIVKEKEEKGNGDGENNCSHPMHRPWRIVEDKEETHRPWRIVEDKEETHRQWRTVEDKEEKGNGDGADNCSHPTHQQWRIVEDKEDKGNGDGENNCSRVPAHLHSFLRENPRKSLSFSLSSSCSSLPPRPLDSSDPFACHSCNITNVDLQTLDSQWRVVLLCRGCLDRIRLAAVCSYCFACFSALDFDVLTCRGCKCRIHLRCVPLQRGYFTLSEMDPASFTCIDCCAIPRPQFRNPTVTKSLSQDFLRIASSAAKKKTTLAAKAREKALKKAEQARLAMERAFDAILFARDAVVADEKLALQLHLAMNGSPRTLSGAGTPNVDHEINSKKACGDLRGKMKDKRQRKRKGRINDNDFIEKMRRKKRWSDLKDRLKCRKRWKWKEKFHEKGRFCSKDDAFSQSKDMLSKEKCSVKVGIAMGRDLPKVDADCASSSVELALHERKDLHLDLLVNSYGDTQKDGALPSLRESADSNSYMDMSVCGGGAGDCSRELQEEKQGAMRDRCDIKYFKRKSRSKILVSTNKVKVQSNHSDASTFADCKSTSVQGLSFPASGSVS